MTDPDDEVEITLHDPVAAYFFCGDDTRSLNERLVMAAILMRVLDDPRITIEAIMEEAGGMWGKVDAGEMSPYTGYPHRGFKPRSRAGRRGHHQRSRKPRRKR